MKYLGTQEESSRDMILFSNFIFSGFPVRRCTGAVGIIPICNRRCAGWLHCETLQE